MSNIVNYKTGRTVNRQDYVDDGFIDVYERNLIETGLLPCIYYGLNVTAGSGLTVNVAPGAARGQDISFIINGGTSAPLPTVVNNVTTVTTINVPANSIGWIVLNVNIWDSVTNTTGPSSNGDLYEIGASTSSAVPSGSSAAPMFVTSLQPNTNSVWPFTQIPLAFVGSNASTITTISQNYNPANVQRAFDFQASLISIAQGKLGNLAYLNANNINLPVTFTNTVGSTVAPAFPNALTTKTYVDSTIQEPDAQTIVIGANIGKYKIKSGVATMPYTGGTSGQVDVSFITPFTTSMLLAIVSPVEYFNSGGVVPLLTALNYTVSGFLLRWNENNAGADQNQTFPVSWIAIGV